MVGFSYPRLCLDRQNSSQVLLCLQSCSLYHPNSSVNLLSWNICAITIHATVIAVGHGKEVKVEKKTRSVHTFQNPIRIVFRYLRYLRYLQSTTVFFFTSTSGLYQFRAMRVKKCRTSGVKFDHRAKSISISSTDKKFDHSQVRSFVLIHLSEKHC